MTEEIRKYLMDLEVKTQAALFAIPKPGSDYADMLWPGVQEWELGALAFLLVRLQDRVAEIRRRADS